MMNGAFGQASGCPCVLGPEGWIQGIRVKQEAI